MAASSKDLALAIIHFLTTSVANKTVSEEFAESVDVAIDCIADAFAVDKADAPTAVDGRSLLDFVNDPARAPAHSLIDEETKDKANALKGEGNKAMAAKDFDTAIAKYTEAIGLGASYAVFLSNRAAAYSSSSQHAKAVEDAKAAIALDPGFSKAFSRLGLAEYALGNAKAAMEAYKRGLDIEGSQPSDAMKRGYETAKKRVEEELDDCISEGEVAKSSGASQDASGAGAGTGASAGGFPNLSSMFGGGGMPSLSEMMNNPQLMQAAQNLMSNPEAIQGLMNNPALQGMAKQFLGGQGGQNKPKE
ncbi:TPR-like protein [Metschnikowia bicuspidata]|uniref:TPR-like protein n=1 Tax=Metschnikowia bicuspidata TaxID=27322 RepID=A0A4P9ZAT4_9ASCO|nr:TPR-like protein [Metschnikowia bicuspidata]